MHSIALIGALMPFFAAAINNQNATLYWFETKLDHFASNGNSSTFKMRYLVQEDYWDPVNGPIFFYTGNEGSIWNFYNNTGFMTETLAKEFNALVVFSEHRYFGESFPVSKEMSFTPEYTRYLTVEQVMMDYVLLLKEIKHTWDVEHQPVIAFGGSYGGMLSAWMRMKYPSAIQGALAASAPILYFQGATDPEAFNVIISNSFGDILPDMKCNTTMQQTFADLKTLQDSKEDWKAISTAFQTCKDINSTEDVADLYAHLMNGFAYMAMTNYPYESSFLEPMPAWPVNASCQYYKDVKEANIFDKAYNYVDSFFKPVTAGKITPDMTSRFEATLKAINVYYNFTGQVPCTNFSDTEGTGNLDGYGWNVLACNEIAMPIGSNGKTDPFWNKPFNYTAYNQSCGEQFGTSVQYQWALDFFGGRDISRDFQHVSNIIFSNGNLDPWSAGGVTKNVSDDSIAIMIKDGAHHLDLRTPNIDDPESVIEARNIERMWIKKWIDEYKN